MLGKLFKHELIDLFRKTILYFSIVIGLSILVFIFGKLSENYIFFGFVNQLFLIGYFLSIAGILIYSIFYPVTRYYKSMLKDEGYLTHTLPVTKGQLLFSKLVSAFILFFVSLIVFAVSFLILIGTLVPIDEFITLIKQLISGISSSDFVSVILLFTYLIIYYFSAIMLFITALTLGHSRSIKKGTNSLFAGIIIYFIQQGLGTIILGVLFLSTDFQQALETGEFNPTSIILISMITYLILVVAEILTTHYFLKKKLNIE